MDSPLCTELPLIDTAISADGASRSDVEIHAVEAAPNRRSHWASRGSRRDLRCDRRGGESSSQDTVEP